jgi:multicomponent Na+:H+ antiporter subunit E
MIRRVLPRVTLLAVLWWALVEGRFGGWPLTLAVFLLALAAALALRPPRAWKVSPGGLLRFLPWFALQSFLGGVDVARRAFDPRLPLRPGFLDHRLRVDEGTPRLFFVGALSLLPGTLSVRIDEGTDALRVHALDAGPDVPARLRELEARVADLFGVPEQVPPGEG